MLDIIGYLAIIILTLPFSFGLIIGAMNHIGYYQVIGGSHNKPLIRIASVIIILSVVAYWIWFISLIPIKITLIGH